MATIPTLPGSKVPNVSTGGVQMNMGAAMAPGQGMVAAARGLSDASQVTGEFAMRKMEAINKTAVVAARMEMEKAEADFQSSLKENQDEETWLAGFQKVANETQTRVLGDKNLSQAARDALSSEFQVWGTRGAIAVKNQAERRTIQRQKAKLETVADFMIQNGRLDEALHAYDVMEDAGLIFPEAKVQMQMEATKRFDFQQANKLINEDPFAAEEQLTAKGKDGAWSNFKHVDENTRQSLKVEALRRTSALRAETVQDIVNRRNAGEIVKPEDLQKLVDTKRLTPTQMKWVLQEQGRSGHDASVTVNFAQSLSRVDKYDPAKDPTNERFAELVGERMKYPAQYRDELEKRLNKRMNPTSTDKMTKEADGYIDDLLRGGFFGDIGTDRGAALNPQEYEAAHGKAIELRQALDGFVKQNPKATPLEQRDFVNGLLRKERSVRAATPILNGLSGAVNRTSPKTITSKAEFDALPSGAVFTYNGKTGTKI